MKSIIAWLCIWSLPVLAGCFYRVDLDDDDDDADDDWGEAVVIASGWGEWPGDAIFTVIEPFAGRNLSGASSSLTRADGAPDAGPLRVALADEGDRLGFALAAPDVDGAITWTAASACALRHASGQLASAGRTLAVEVRDYLRCGPGCPTSGVVILSDGTRSARLTFDGGDQALLERSDGSVERMQLACAR